MTARNAISYHDGLPKPGLFRDVSHGHCIAKELSSTRVVQDVLSDISIPFVTSALFSKYCRAWPQ